MTLGLLCVQVALTVLAVSTCAGASSKEKTATQLSSVGPITASYNDCSAESDVDADDEFKCGFAWATTMNETGNYTCKCGNSLHETVYCKFNEDDTSYSNVGILDCSCMTYDENRNETVVGHCLHNCVNGSDSNSNTHIERVYHRINRNLTPRNFTNRICGYMHREGRLCGKCEEGYYPPVYSYTSKCVKCPNHWYNWVLFVFEAFPLLTLFLVFVLVFRVSATSAQLNAFVLFSQSLAVPANVRVVLASVRNQNGPLFLFFVKIITTLYGIWNLDFLRTIYPPLCLHVTTLQVIILEYSIAFYPLLLLMLIYLATKLQLHRVRGIKCLWSPFNNTLTNIRQIVSLKRSIIDAFATFLILSYIRLLSVSFDLLMFTTVHNARGHAVGVYLYNDATIEYFRSEHLHYAVAAILIFLVFVILPMILLLVYPMRCFQRCLTRLHLNRELLRSFMDSFQGCYKDGTNGTRDCRYFAGFYLLLRIVLFLAYGITLTSLFYPIATIIFLAMGILIVTVRPYKERYAVYNKVDAIMILNQALGTASILCINFAIVKGRRFLTFSVVLAAVFNILPLVYITIMTVHWLKTRNCSHVLVGKLKDVFMAKCIGNRDDEHRELGDSAQCNYGTMK